MAGKPRRCFVKRLIACVLLLVVLLVSLWVADHWAFRANQATALNYYMVHNGMGKESVRWLLGHGFGTDAPLVADPNSPGGVKPIVSGEFVMVFHNLPPPTPYEAIYVGVVNNRVVDKAWFIQGAPDK
jgi:hypothetical protein